MNYGYYNTDQQSNGYNNYQGDFGMSGNSPQKNPKKTNGMAKKVTALVMSGVLFGGIAGGTFLGVNALGGKYANNQISTNQLQSAGDSSTKTVSNVNTGSGAQGQSLSGVSEVAENVMPSIVAITNTSVRDVQSIFGTMQQEIPSSGSGIIVGQNDTELLIATNNHVIDAADEITVKFVDDEIIQAQLKGTDPSNDLAVIAVKLTDIPDETMSAIKVAELGDSDAISVGEQVVAIGNALGYGQSVTTGIVSALDREVQVENMVSKLIQTDAAINPGNSGGALLNMNGQVIGINSVKFASSEVEGMGYAIPVSTAKPIIEELMNQTTREKASDEERGYLGVANPTDVTSEISERYGMPVGVYVSDVTEVSAAADAGIKKGDIITKLDGIAITSATELINKLQYYKAGETVSIEVAVKTADGYDEQTFEVTLQGKAETDTNTQQESTEDNPMMENSLR